MHWRSILRTISENAQKAQEPHHSVDGNSVDS